MFESFTAHLSIGSPVACGGHAGIGGNALITGR